MIEGQKIIVYFDDGERVGRREGKVTKLDTDFIELDNKEIISKNRIIRAEVLDQ